MRPQRNAGEYRAADAIDRRRGVASMRPQRNAGEYRAVRIPRGKRNDASMRPQRNAGEYDAEYEHPYPANALQ